MRYLQNIQKLFTKYTETIYNIYRNYLQKLQEDLLNICKLPTKIHKIIILQSYQDHGKVRCLADAVVDKAFRMLPWLECTRERIELEWCDHNFIHQYPWHPNNKMQQQHQLNFPVFWFQPIVPSCLRQTNETRQRFHVPFGSIWFTLGIIQSNCSNDPYAHAGYKADIPTFEQLNTQ